MFTGLIQEMGTIKEVKRQGHTIKMTCKASSVLLEDYKIGDSMAIDGVCLTAIEKQKDTFTVEMMPETFSRTIFSQIKVGRRVNLERAMQVQQRFEGHMVAGHVDRTVRLIDKKRNENAIVLTFEYPNDLKGEIIAQGSIAINGVSLTVIRVTANSFSVSLIPHSASQTTLGELIRGGYVNIETDMVGKYIKAQRGYQADLKEELVRG